MAKKGPEKWVYDVLWQPRKMVRDDYVNKHDRVDQEDIWGNNDEEVRDKRRQEEKRNAMKNFLLNYGMRKRGNANPATKDPEHYYLHM